MGDSRRRPPQAGVRAVPTALLISRLDQALQDEIAQAGLAPFAVRGYVEVPAQGQSPARKGQALICRLVPTSPRAKIAFWREQQHCAEAVVFEDPDDIFEWNLKAGFQNALYAAQHLFEAARQ